MNCERIFKENMGHFVKIHLIPTKRILSGTLEHIYGHLFFVRNFHGLMEMVRLEDIRAIESERKIEEGEIAYGDN